MMTAEQEQALKILTSASGAVMADRATHDAILKSLAIVKASFEALSGVPIARGLEPKKEE